MNDTIERVKLITWLKEREDIEWSMSNEDGASAISGIIYAIEQGEI